MESEGSLPDLQEPAICPCLEPGRTNAQIILCSHVNIWYCLLKCNLFKSEISLKIYKNAVLNSSEFHYGSRPVSTV